MNTKRDNLLAEKALLAALELSNGPFNLARRLGYRPNRVTNWVMRGHVPPGECPAVSLAVDGGVSLMALMGFEDVTQASNDSSSEASA